MSKKDDLEIVCPFCNHKDVYSCWGAVNVNLNPELKEQLLSNRLNVEQCKKCSKNIQIESEVFYHDMERLLMIEYFPANSVQDRIERFQLIQSRLDPKGLSSIKKGYKYRYVWTRQQLLEKIRIFDANLNDRIIEVYKFWLNALNVARDVNSKCDVIYFDRLDIDNDSMHFSFVKEARLESRIIHNKLYRDLLMVIGKDFIEEDKWNIIDEDYGKTTLLERAKRL